MPGTQDWTRLQRQLSDYGYLEQENVVEIHGEQDISPALRRALTAARQGLDGTFIEHEQIGFDRIDDLAPVGRALDGRFCGVPDQGGTIGFLTFGSPGGRWGRGRLNVSINVAGCNFNDSSPAPTNPGAVIMGAFTQWQTVSNFFMFNFVAPGTGEDIRVIFGGQATDVRFGRLGGILASAGYPERGDLQFDSAEQWTPNGLLGTALHEIGHLLGLSHSNAPGGTMYPYANNALTIDRESRDALNAIYGWQPQQYLPDRGTSNRAMLGVTSFANFTGRSEVPHMVWKGIGDDTAIYYSRFTGSWTPQQRVEGIGSSHSAALTEIAIPGSGNPSTGLFMAWKGIPDDQGLYWTRDLGAGWEPQRLVDNAGSGTAPALANLNGRIYMAWKGIEGDSGIYWSVYDGAEGWFPQSRILGVGTSDSPALAAFNGKLYLFWKGSPGDSNAYYSSFDPAGDPIWRPQRRIEYFSYETVGGVALPIGTSGPLSATVRGNRLLLVWKGVDGDSSIWFSFFQNDEFSGQATVPDIGSSDGPSIAHADGISYLAWKGIEGDTGVYWTRL